MSPAKRAPKAPRAVWVGLCEQCGGICSVGLSFEAARGRVVGMCECTSRERPALALFDFVGMYVDERRPPATVRGRKVVRR